MLDVPAATNRIRRQMAASEQTLADAIVECTALTHTLAIAAKDNPDVAIVEAQGALLRAHKAIGGLLEVRGDVTRLHGQLRTIGLNILAPEEPPCPKTGQGDEEPTIATLRVA